MWGTLLTLILGVSSMAFASGPVVVLDPGHGGMNSGAQGVGESLEKDVTLQLARRVARHLERRSGVEVVLTREGDYHIGLRERAQMANLLSADVFISIHCNASKVAGPSGFETWYLSKGGAREALHEAAAAAASKRQASGATSQVLGELLSAGSRSGSRLLAEAVQQAVGARVE